VFLQTGGYNRIVGRLAPILLFCCLAACQHAVRSDDAVRQAVMDTLKARGDLNLDAMDVKIDSVKYEGAKADATVSFALKGNQNPMMRMVYHLVEKDNRWVVAARADSAGHGATAVPGAENPHAENPHGGGKMPSPEDLPPAGPKK
jgi:hypothetical protein